MASQFASEGFKGGEWKRLKREQAYNLGFGTQKKEQKLWFADRASKEEEEQNCSSRGDEGLTKEKNVDAINTTLVPLIQSGMHRHTVTPSLHSGKHNAAMLSACIKGGKNPHTWLHMAPWQKRGTQITDVARTSRNLSLSFLFLRESAASWVVPE